MCKCAPIVDGVVQKTIVRDQLIGGDDLSRLDSISLNDNRGGWVLLGIFCVSDETVR